MVESTGMSATPTRGTLGKRGNTKALDELNACSQENLSVQCSAREKKKKRKITIHFTFGKKKAGKLWKTFYTVISFIFLTYTYYLPHYFYISFHKI